MNSVSHKCIYMKSVQIVEIQFIWVPKVNQQIYSLYSMLSNVSGCKFTFVSAPAFDLKYKWI